MARVFTRATAKRLVLPGRVSLEMVSGDGGSQAVTLRVVEIPVEESGNPNRGTQEHDFEECIYVLSGTGTTFTPSAEHSLCAGDAILIAPREKHMTRNTGAEPLVLLCFFPVAEIQGGTRENPAEAK